MAGVVALVGYIVVGAVIPLFIGKKGAASGMEFRSAFGDLNSFILDSLRGLDETIQYGGGKKRMQAMDERSKELGEMQKELNRLEASQRSVTNMVILLFSFGMLFLMLHYYVNGAVGFEHMLIAVIAMMGSFGPTVALSNLSNNLNQTLASGERVLSLLEENPQVEEVEGREAVEFTGASASHVDFAYGEEQILKDYSMDVPKGKVIGIHGASGSGKSTFLKLLMRFWDRQKGDIFISGRDVREINTSNLRDMESYVTQETYLFHDSIANNIGVGKPGASREEIIEAAKKASIHDFIQTLPKGYDTEVGELGDTLSGGERQRISIARALLKDAPIILLDEATASLDPENEVLIQRAIAKLVEGKAVMMITLRLRTGVNSDQIIVLKDGKLAELGTHEKLMKKKGLYEKLYHIQQESLGWAV